VDDLSNIKGATATINLGKGFPVKDVTFAQSASGSTYTYDPNTGDLKLTIKNEGASKQAGELALITVSVPSTTVEGTKIPYSITSGNMTLYNTQEDVFNASFSTKPGEVPVVAAYQIQVERMIVGSDGTLQVLTQDGQPVSGAEVSMTSADGKTQALGTTDAKGMLSSALPTSSLQKFTLTAHKDSGYSFPVSAQSFKAQNTATPSNIFVGSNQDPKTEKSVTWMTNPLQDEDKAIMQVATKEAYVAQGDQAFQNFNGTKQLLTYSNDSSAINLNSAKATGLKPGTAYVFRVGDGKNWSDVRDFNTLTDSDHMTFNVFGDTQVTDPSGLDNFDKILTRIENDPIKSDFAIHIGDFTDDQTIFNEADITAEFFNKHPAFDSLDMIHVLGNHEYQGDDGTKSAAMLAIPNTNGPDANKMGTYSVDYGNMHIAVIGWTDNADTMKQEMDWLRSDMKATHQTWKIIATHQPTYNKNPDDAQSMMFHDMLAPVCDELGIDLVFNGHDHSYGRTYPLVGHKQASVGTTYIATGHTGDKTYEILPNDPSVFEVVQKDKNEVVYLTAHVNGNKMELIAEHPDGSVVDDVTLTAHPADKTALEETVKAAKALNLNDYSITGQNDFVSALSNAQKVLDDENAIPQDVSSALNDLTKAQAALKKSADKTALEDAIAKANKLDLTKYKEAGQAAFKTKLQDATAMYDNKALSVDDQKQVDTMTDELNQAIDSLQPINGSGNEGNSNNSGSNDGQGNQGNEGNSNNSSSNAGQGNQDNDGNSNASTNSTTHDQSNAKGQYQLPNTGNMFNAWTLSTIGVVLILIGAGIMMKRKRKEI
jgi:LPXTG-motif cell wall-anchored protein